MKYDISNYQVTSRTVFGDKAKLFLQSKNNSEDVRVLELDGVVGYFDCTQKSDLISCLRIDDKGGSYNIDLSMRLRRQEIVEYPEVFIFKDQDCVSFVFRAVAKSIKYRRLEKRDNWMKGW
jgi:hypothetical protein